MIIHLLALLGTVSAGPLLPRQDAASLASSSMGAAATATAASSAAAPSVTIYPAGTGGDGVVVSGSSNNIVDSYYGIPFAAPREWIPPARFTDANSSRE